MNKKFAITLVLAICAGILIGNVDSRPAWDDTGVTVLSLLAVSCAFGFLYARRAWVWALAIGAGVPFFEFKTDSIMVSIVTFVFTFLGAYAGVFIQMSMHPMQDK